MTKPKDPFARFKEWIVARGGELLIPTNEYEVLRFRGGGLTSIIYTSKGGNITYTGRAREAWLAFEKGDSTFRLTGRAKSETRQMKRSVLIRTIVQRDGNGCFYCGVSFEVEKPTKEHLVPRTAGGPDHLGNIFLSCEPCNRDVGHKSAPEKIRYRDLKRRGIGTTLLVDLRPHVERLSDERQPNGPNFLNLLARIDQIIHTPKKETTDA